MKPSTTLLATALVANVAIAADTKSAAQCRIRSDEILAALEQADFATATQHFDAAMRTVLSAEKLQQVWTQTLPAQVGHYEKHGTTEVTTLSGEALAKTRLQFAGAWLEMRVSCDANGGVRGLFFAPGAPVPAPLIVTPPASSEHALDIASPFGPLPGMFALPAGDGPFPAVLLVAGSGPQDRDETIGPNKPLADIARGLAQAGIASLRYDKRTKVYGAQMAGKAITIDDEVTDDAVAAAALLARQPGIDAKRVFVLGHSLGALMAPRIAQRDTQIAGLILLAAPEKLDLNVVLRQTRYLAGLQHATQQQTDDAIAPIVAARTAIAMADPAHPPAGEFFHAPASYWLSLRDYDAIAVTRTLPQPLLILQGASDYQVTPIDDFAKWKAAFAASTRVTLKQYDGLSHLFMPAGNPPSPADYNKPGHVDAQVIDDVVQWISSNGSKT